MAHPKQQSGATKAARSELGQKSALEKAMSLTDQERDIIMIALTPLETWMRKQINLGIEIEIIETIKSKLNG